MRRHIIHIIAIIFSAATAMADMLPAKWIMPPTKGSDSLQAAFFRKTLDIDNVPQSYMLDISADNRYKLYVNGNMVSLGPARGDLANWNYETVDIAPYLNAGTNYVAAIVWNYGDNLPAALAGTRHIAFMVNDPNGNLTSDSSWHALPSDAYSAYTDFTVPGYYVAGPGENVDAGKYPWGWATGEDSSNWLNAVEVSPAATKGTRDCGGRMLVARDIPMMELCEVSAGHLKLPLTIPANSSDTILIDRHELTNAYLNIGLSGGKGASIKICYMESLFDKDMPDIWHASKHNRNETDGKVALGTTDQFVMDGGAKRTFTTLAWRTWRYIQLVVTTQNQPLTIDSLSATFTAYPFEKLSKFTGSDNLAEIEKIGWQTARLCANETYMDCPYYEQLQYFGDTRLQSVITMYNTSDKLLPRRAIENGRMSMTPDGITQSRYPCSDQQMISSYALSWIGMLYDYWMLRGDEQWLKTYLPAARSIAAWYEQFLREDKSLSHVPYWFFADWADGFDYGEPNYGSDGASAYQDLVYILALRELAAMENAFGIKEMGIYYQTLSDGMAATIRSKFYDNGRRLLADTSDHDIFSQHVNSLAILADIFTGEEAADVCRRLLSEDDLIQASYYFRYFVQLAMDKAGLADIWQSTLEPWHNQIALGLTTWAENPEPSRSDCHAWSASPNIEIYRMLLGIHSIAPGFKEVLITPALGDLAKASGVMPHPNGNISVDYKIKNGVLTASIELPKGVIGNIVWDGDVKPIYPGLQTIKFEP